ncbi:hypothetical protein PV356_23600 [Streptomyces sp. WI03-5b]|uniref:hypothetical protein n=1 Tax=Streptomyces sp. WI03-5b TaxID=462946 RepID=UPI0029AED5E3|nr:hypothetical protein [Streptomyces sp. WI03-5b]MDX2622485.1 hypothetical protein [Streptomyces sp. WI03-5b]
MTTEITAPAQALAPWRSAQQEATNATWHVSSLVDVAPYCVSQTERGTAYTYAGDLHYSDPAPVHAIAAEYGVTVTETPAGDTDVRICALVTVDGIEVRAWATQAAPQTGGAA